MRWLRVLALSVIVGVLGCAAAASQAPQRDFVIGRDIRITPAEHLSAYEIWHSAQPQTIASGEAAVMLLVLDPEDAPNENGQALVAIVLVGEFGTGIEPIGIRISAPDSRSIRVVPRTGQSEAFDVVVDDVVTSLTVGPDGRVWLGAHDLGTIH